MFIKSLLVNGVRRQVLVNADDSLANVLRDQLQLTSVKLAAKRVTAAPAASSSTASSRAPAC